ncbi:MAG: hypothetical protein ABJD66_08625 [Cellulophaga sp.]|uniref:hypothetical protein n=1 Tax=Cellulophaga sp. TaxID=1972202 RepID=UPI0032651783
MKKLLFVVLIASAFAVSCDGKYDEFFDDIEENVDEEVIDVTVDNLGGVDEITKVQPMTGIVLWDDNNNNNKGVNSLEYSYMNYDDIVSQKGVYDWTAVENKLNDIASRNHQAILRFRITYPGFKTTVPQYIKNSNGYIEKKAKAEGEDTWYPDWRSQELKDFILEFYEKFALEYDEDNRLAFIQVGFGHYAEYHNYNGLFIEDRTFPSKSFQTTFLNKLNDVFYSLHWSFSIDAKSSRYSPFSQNTSLLNLPFGVFDDSFMNIEDWSDNVSKHNFFGRDRFEISPIGGEFSYYTDYDQENVLSPTGTDEEPFETFAADFHITYIIGNDQFEYQSKNRIKEASLATGYKFEVTKFVKIDGKSILTVKNNGIAPIYYDAYLSIAGHDSNESLKSLMPGEESVFTIDHDGDEELEIYCPRLLDGQVIDFVNSY